MKRYTHIALPLLIMMILLVLLVARWGTVAKVPSFSGTQKYEIDRLTGYIFFSQYGSRTFYRQPVDAYDSYKNKWDQNTMARINRLKNIVTIFHWVILSVTIIWLVVSYKKSFEESGR